MTLKEDLACESELFLPQIRAMLWLKDMLQRAMELQRVHPLSRLTALVSDAASTE